MPNARGSGSWCKLLLTPIGAALALQAPPAPAACRILQLAALSVSGPGNSPQIDGAINGQKVAILLDSGSYHSWIDGAAARRLGLVTRDHGGIAFGVGGKVQRLSTDVQHLRLGQVFHAEHVTLDVLDTGAHGMPSGIALVLGENFFAHYTMEFDLAHRVVRLLRPQHCQPEQLAYWTDAFFMAKTQPFSDYAPHITLQVLINGHPERAWLDSGSQISLISQEAAARAGVRPEKMRAWLHGVSGMAVHAWIGNFESLALGNETIHNAQLEVADLFGSDRIEQPGSYIAQRDPNVPDVLLGADFLMAHRLVVAPDARRVLFTYNGGRVFQIIHHAAPHAAPPAPAASQTTPPHPVQPADPAAAPEP